MFRERLHQVEAGFQVLWRTSLAHIREYGLRVDNFETRDTSKITGMRWHIYMGSVIMSLGQGVFISKRFRRPTVCRNEGVGEADKTNERPAPVAAQGHSWPCSGTESST